MKPKQTKLSLLFIAFIPFGYWLYRYLFIDFWYDEVYSIQNFVLNDFFTGVVLNYPVPNNHIVLNLLGQLLAKLFDVNYLNDVASKVVVFRFFQVVVAMLTAMFSVNIVKQFFSKTHAFLLPVLLFTTIPFMNFALQWRGYNLSGLWLVMLVFCVFNFIEKRQAFYRNSIVILSTLLVYTIPSNIYMLAAIIVAFCWFILVEYKRNNNAKVKLYLHVLLYVSLGIGLATLFYLPIINEVLFNDFSARKTSDFWYGLKLFPTLSLAFLSQRFVLLVLFVFGVLVMLLKQKLNTKYSLLLFLFVMPFVFAFIHQKLPFQRVFVPLAPVFCLVIAISIINLLQTLPKTLGLVAVNLVAGYCVFMFFTEVKNNDVEIAENLLARNEVMQDVYQNYYLSSSFNQTKTMQQVKALNTDTVFLLEQWDLPSTFMYLNKHKINHRLLYSKEDLNQVLLRKDSAVILTTFPNNFVNDYKQTVVVNEFPMVNAVMVSLP